uniref:Uncharacterized protein n=1 Tax=Gossypium raimondii TaxID=29730 RepID=A0A0D2QVI3_GOSRA|nr:hypothetical protein B456_004G107600 [Gossypium raimondii]
MAWKSVLGVLCDCNIPKWKMKFRRMTIWLDLLYGKRMLANKKQLIQKVGVVEMKDRVIILDICLKVGIAPMDDKDEENCLQLFGHIRHGLGNAPDRKSKLTLHKAKG